MMPGRKEAAVSEITALREALFLPERGEALISAAEGGNRSSRGECLEQVGTWRDDGRGFLKHERFHRSILFWPDVAA